MKKGLIFVLIALVAVSAILTLFLSSEKESVSPERVHERSNAPEIKLPEQSSEAGGILVEVAPRVTGAGGVWEFEVALTTHAGSLDHDLEKTSVLLGNNTTYNPEAWSGDPPGGHHRKGILRFKTNSPLTSSVELKIEGIGGADPMVFRWDLP